MKHIHFIGICGVAMSALALAFKERSWKVTGSDKGFYPPVSTNLEKGGVDFYPGWHPEKMIEGGVPDLVVVGNVAASQNPEWLYVQKHNIPYLSYPEATAKYLIAPNSIVCAGTYGKTTSATILAWIFDSAGMNANHMFGGIAQNNIPAARMREKAEWSVVEGDEYKAARWDEKAKFFHYSPTHLLLTGMSWDHADVYPTEASYMQAFVDLVKMVPESGVLMGCADEGEVMRVLAESERSFITYGKIDPVASTHQHINTSTPGSAMLHRASSDFTTLRWASADTDTQQVPDGATYEYSSVTASKNGTAFDISHTPSGEIFHIEIPMLGDFTAKNATGCFAMAHMIGVAPEKIISALGSFKGIKRRLEKRGAGAVDVYDDIAHSPAKAAAVLGSIKKLYAGKIVAVFEPNTGNRKEESIPAYAGAFQNADEVIIPRLTSVKEDADDAHPPFDGERLAAVIGETHPNARYIPEDEKLVSYLRGQTKPGDVIMFLGSHGFRGMIEEVVEPLNKI